MIINPSLDLYLQSGHIPAKQDSQQKQEDPAMRGLQVETLFLVQAAFLHQPTDASTFTAISSLAEITIRVESGVLIFIVLMKSFNTD
jgi:hypothetical protein